MYSYQTISTSTFINSKVGGSGEKYKMMKNFNITVKEYLHSKSDSNSSEINKHLAHIVSDMELSIFDPHNAVTAEFYVNLFELMNSFDSSSGGLVWCTVAVLERACHNPVARLSLIHTYRFVPILSKLLLNVVGTDKRIRMLTLMQDLTYGIKITWQEPHLATLMSQLLEWVRSGNDQLATLSLSVMVNLCYKNLPSTYILTRLVDTKVFIDSLVKLRNNNNSMQVHLWKMVIILESMTGETSEDDLKRFLEVTFQNVEQSFKNRDMAMLRHVVDFFIDMRGQSNTRKTLESSVNFQRDVESLLTSVENNSTPMKSDMESGDSSSTDPTCMAMLFEFIHSLLLLGLPQLEPLHPRLVALALKWVQPEPASSQALGIIRTICQQSGDSMPPSILEQLSQGFTFLALSLEGQNLLTDTPEHITSMIQLLLAMAKRQKLVEKVLASINETWVNSVFSSLTETDEDKPNIDSSSPQYTAMYVHCLSLVAQLASLNHQQWALYLIQLLRKPPIQSVIARALYTGSPALREQIMKLIQMRECEFPIAEVAKILCDLGPIVMASNQSGQNFSDSGLGMPIMSVVQHGRLDKLIAKLEEASARNQLSNPVTSEIMELYDYKLAAMSHAERSAQSSLEAASGQITSLNHRLALMSNELERLHGMLYTIQLSHEKLTNEKKASTVRMAEIQINLKESNSLLQNEKDKRVKTVHDLKTRLDNTEIRLNDCVAELEAKSAGLKQLSEEKKRLEQQNKELSSVLEKYEERYKSYKNKVEEGEKALMQSRKTYKEQSKELESLQQIRNEHEQKLIEKDNQILKLKDELKELEQMRDLIVTISTKKRM